MFNGENPDSWIRKVEKYFSFYQLGEREKLEAAAVSFEGEAEIWFDWEEQNENIRNWQDLKYLILSRFRPWDEGEMCEQWLSVEQTGSVAEYRSEFVSRLTHLGKKEESMMIGAFMRGLTEDIKTELKVLGSTNLGQAMSWAEKIEAKIIAQSHTWLGRRGEPMRTNHHNHTHNKSFSHNPNSQNSRNPPSRNYPPNNYKPMNTYLRGRETGGPSGDRVWRLSDKEWRERKAKGLCYRCDETWSVNHNCSKKELSVLIK
ncbi:unnamed protein product [Amaranthus hypochondriacus]